MKPETLDDARRALACLDLTDLAEGTGAGRHAY